MIERRRRASSLQGRVVVACVAACVVSWACSEAPATPSPPPAPSSAQVVLPSPRVDEPTPLCGTPLVAELREVVPKLERCGDPWFQASYLRLGFVSRDLVLVQTTDSRDLLVDGPPHHDAHLVVDGRLASCTEARCPELERLAPSELARLSDEDATLLLTMVLSLERGRLVRSAAELERLAGEWEPHLVLLRGRPLGLVREERGLTLNAWRVYVDTGMHGVARDVHYVSASLGVDDGAVRLHVTTESALREFVENRGTPCLPRGRDETSLEDLEL